MFSIPVTGQIDAQTLTNMRNFAQQVIGSREPSQIIGDHYMRRWHVAPNNPMGNFYIHEILKSDEDCLHDHPWDSVSIILRGSYLEETPDGVFHRKVGSAIRRQASDLHRLIVADGNPCLSVFLTGPKIREWGFQTEAGWVDWRKFLGLEAECV